MAVLAALLSTVILWQLIGVIVILSIFACSFVSIVPAIWLVLAGRWLFSCSFGAGSLVDIVARLLVAILGVFTPVVVVLLGFKENIINDVYDSICSPDILLSDKGCPLARVHVHLSPVSEIV